MATRERALYFEFEGRHKVHCYIDFVIYKPFDAELHGYIVNLGFQVLLSLSSLSDFKRPIRNTVTVTVRSVLVGKLETHIVWKFLKAKSIAGDRHSCPCPCP